MAVLGSRSFQLKALSYLAAAGGVCATAAFRALLTPVLEQKTLYLVFIPAVLLSALYGGLGPGVLSLLLSTTFALSILTQGGAEDALTHSSNQASLVLFLAVCVGILALAHKERDEKRRRKSAEAELSQLNVDLETRVQERTKALEASNRELEGFCYSVAHDLRTPMRAIAGNARILLEDYGDKVDEEVARKLVRMEAAANKLGDLVEGLLIFARLASQELATEEVNLADLIQDAVTSMEREDRCEVHLDMPDRIIVQADPKIARIAVNALIKNAVRYRKSGQPAVVKIAQSGNRVTIADEGIGFEMTYVEKIFLPFERLHRDEDYAGVGMGLALVRRIVERHHGCIEAESELGQGSRFTLSFG
jgi:signal transduction histidine kinase